MKIALISPNKDNLQKMAAVLETCSHKVVQIEGEISRMTMAAEQEHPDVIIVESMCYEPHELEQVGDLTTQYPHIAVILLCVENNPEFLISSMRAGVREVLPSPVSADALRAATDRIATKLMSAGTRRNGKVLAFMPCKGGSGATFLATNFGYQLAETKNVLLIDLNLQFGDALSFVHDNKPNVTIADLAHDINRLDASFLIASAVKIAPNYSILAAPEEPSQAMEVKPEHIEVILKLAVAHYDFVLLDLPRTLDPISIKALDFAYRVFPVLQASFPHLRNASKLMSVFRSLDYPTQKIELIINRFEKKGEIGMDAIQRALDACAMHTVPNSYKEVSTSVNHGNPLVRIARSNVVTRNLADFVLAVSPKPEETRGMLGRLFKRA